MEHNEKVIRMLFHLAQLDIDAVFAYEQALEYIDRDEERFQLAQFKLDYVDQIEALTHVIENLGGIAPENKKDLQGYWLEGMTMIRSVTGTEGALKAMRSTNETIHKKYAEALHANMTSGDILKIIQTHYDNSKRHLSYIDKRLNAFANVEA